jgi:hypothetical protein
VALKEAEHKALEEQALADFAAAEGISLSGKTPPSKADEGTKTMGPVPQANEGTKSTGPISQ